MPTEMELTLEQTQQGVSYEVSNIRVNSFTMKMEILLEPTSNKLMVVITPIEFSINFSIQSEIVTSQVPLISVLLNTIAENPVKKILLKLNLSDHRGLRGEGAFEEGPSRRRGLQGGDDSEVDIERRRRLHPLGGYVITLYRNGKLHTRVTVTLVSEAEVSSKGVGLRVADSHTGNHGEDDFTPLETFRETYVRICDAPSHIYIYEALYVSRLLQRLQQRLQAATKVVGYCEGCNRGFLLRRLPQRLQAVVKVATKVAGCNIAKKAATLLRRLQCNMTEVYEAVTHVMQRSWVAVMKIMPIDQGLQGGRAFEEDGPSKRRGLRGEGASEEEMARNSTEVRLCVGFIL
ncbi:hypothetical protein Tco_0563765 [Tanacetum coccineum]